MMFSLEDKRLKRNQKEGAELLVKVELACEGESCMEAAGRVSSKREEMGSSSFPNCSWVTFLCQVLCSAIQIQQ